MAGNNKNNAHGKKYNAAERHFKEKEVKYQRQIKNLEARLLAAENKKNQILEEYNCLKAMYEKKDALYQKLLDYSQLSESDLKVALEKDNATLKLASFIGFMGDKLFNY